MVAAPPSTGTQWQKAADVKAGQYFKYYGKWHLAIMDAVSVDKASETGRLYAYAIQALDTNGVDTWVGIFPARHQEVDEDPMVEVTDPGKRPKPFTPATLRRKAKAHEEEAARQRHAADVKLSLARRLENGWLGA